MGGYRLWLAATLTMAGQCGAEGETVGGSVPNIDGQTFTQANCLMNIDNLFVEEGSMQTRTQHGYGERLRLLAATWATVSAARDSLPAAVTVGGSTYYTTNPSTDCSDFGDHFRSNQASLAAAVTLLRGKGGFVVIDDVEIVGLRPNKTAPLSRALYIIGNEIHKNSSDVEDLLRAAGVGGLPLTLGETPDGDGGEVRISQKIVISGDGGAVTARLAGSEQRPQQYWCHSTLLNTTISYYDTCLNILSDGIRKMVRFAGIMGVPLGLHSPVSITPITTTEIKAFHRFSDKHFIMAACGQTNHRILMGEDVAEGSGEAPVDPGLLGCLSSLHAAIMWVPGAPVSDTVTKRVRRWSLMGFLFGDSMDVKQINQNLDTVTRNQEKLLTDEQTLLENEHRIEQFVDVLFDANEGVMDQMLQLADQLSLHSYVMRRVNQAHTNNAQQIRSLLSVTELYYRVVDLGEGAEDEIHRITNAMVGKGGCHQHSESDHLVCRHTHATLSVSAGGETVSSGTGILMGRRPVVTPSCLPRADSTIMSWSGETFLYQGSSGNLVNPEQGSVVGWDCATNGSRCKTEDGAYTRLLGTNREKLHFIAGADGFWVGSSYGRRLSDSAGRAIDVSAGQPVHLNVTQFPVMAGKTRYTLQDVTDSHHRTVFTRKYVEKVDFERVSAAMDLAREVGDMREFEPGRVNIEDLSYTVLDPVDPILDYTGISWKWVLGLGLGLSCVFIVGGTVIRWRYRAAVARACVPHMQYQAVPGGGDGGTVRAVSSLPARPPVQPRRQVRASTARGVRGSTPLLAGAATSGWSNTSQPAQTLQAVGAGRTGSTVPAGPAGTVQLQPDLAGGVSANGPAGPGGTAAPSAPPPQDDRAAGRSAGYTVDNEGVVRVSLADLNSWIEPLIKETLQLVLAERFGITRDAVIRWASSHRGGNVMKFNLESFCVAINCSDLSSAHTTEQQIKTIHLALCGITTSLHP